MFRGRRKRERRDPMPLDRGTCSACGSNLPPDAEFCPACGQRVEPGPAPVAVEWVPPKLFGVVPPSGALALGLGGLLLALIGFATGHWLVGLVLAVVALGLLALFVEAARRFRAPDPAARAAVAVAHRVRAWSGFAAGSANAWSRARREVTAARRELAAIREELDRTQRDLGAAAYREDGPEMDRLRARMRALDERARDREGRIAQALERAHRRVVEERLAIQPTEVVGIDGDEPRR